MVQHRLIRPVRRALLFTAAGFALLGGAWAIPSATAHPASSPPHQAALPADDQPALPASPRTAQLPAGVDALVSAVLDQNLNDLLALVQLTEAPCLPEPIEPVDQARPPLCAELGVPVGTMAGFLPIAGCHPEFVPAGAIAPLLASRLRPDNRLYGVARTDYHPYADSETIAMWPVPDTIVFIEDAALRLVLPDETTLSSGSAYYLATGRLIAVRAFGICGARLPLPADPAWLLPPD